MQRQLDLAIETPMRLIFLLIFRHALLRHGGRASCGYA